MYYKETNGVKITVFINLWKELDVDATDEIQDPELLNFAVENISELFGYLATGRVNIRIHRDITGDMWFGVG